jgi:hypothetical protein
MYLRKSTCISKTGIGRQAAFQKLVNMVVHQHSGITGGGGF